MPIISEDIAIVNQILPHKNKWAWDLYVESRGNNWMPTEVSMAKDIEHWKSNEVLSEDERLLIKRCLGFFAGTESLVANNLLLNIGKWVCDGECRQYIGLQLLEELNHNHTIVYICDSLDLDINEVYEAYNNVPSIKAKDDFLMGITSDIGRSDFSISNKAGKQEFLKNLITYYIICEGIFFYSGFAMLLSLGRQNKMPGISEQIQFTVADESNHLKFGTQLINQIIEENPTIWTKKIKEEILSYILESMKLEVEYAKDVLPNGILGLNSDMFTTYMEYIADRRIKGIGLDSPFVNPKTPFPWMSESIDLDKNKNFFETRVTEYQTGRLVDDF